MLPPACTINHPTPAAKNTFLALRSFPTVLWADKNRSILCYWNALVFSPPPFFPFLFLFLSFPLPRFFFFWCISKSQGLKGQQIGPFSFPGKPRASPTSVTLKDRGAKSSSKWCSLSSPQNICSPEWEGSLFSSEVTVTWPYCSHVSMSPFVCEKYLSAPTFCKCLWS